MRDGLYASIYGIPEKHNKLNLNKCTKTKPKPKPSLIFQNCSYVEVKVKSKVAVDL